MTFCLHLGCTVFMAMIFWGRWEHFYKEGYAIRKDKFRAWGEITLTVVIAYVLYLMWVGK